MKISLPLLLLPAWLLASFCYSQANEREYPVTLAITSTNQLIRVPTDFFVSVSITNAGTNAIWLYRGINTPADYDLLLQDPQGRTIDLNPKNPTMKGPEAYSAHVFYPVEEHKSVTGVLRVQVGKNIQAHTYKLILSRWCVIVPPDSSGKPGNQFGKKLTSNALTLEVR